MSKLTPALRLLLCGLAGGLAWFLGMQLVFAPAQVVLSNPEYQSPKFLAVFFEIEPVPRMAQNPWILAGGLAIIGVFHATAYTALRGSLRGAWLRSGMVFGLLAWCLMAPWFEFYLPWNVMHEPLLLVLLEALLWMVLLQIVGISIAAAHHLMSSRPTTPLTP